MAKIDIAVSRLNGDALSPANMDHLKETFDNLSKTTAALSESSKKIDGVIEKADGTMGSAKEAADKIELAVGDAQKTIQAASRILNEATTRGRVGPIVAYERSRGERPARSDQQPARHGVLFYRDSAAKIAPPPETTPAPRRRSDR